MQNNLNNQFEDKKICAILIDNKLLDRAKVVDILKKKDVYKKNLIKTRKEPYLSSTLESKTAEDITIIDILASLNLKRADKPDVLLDEDSITITLAMEWGLPYKKIDPLKLDLNLVTTTIPRSFAINHMVLPISLNNGCLTMAAFNPFITDVFEDISRATQLKVDVVVSSKTDVLKLINEFFGFQHSISAAEHQFSGLSVDLGNLEQYVRLTSTEELPSNDQHIVNAVTYLFGYALDQKASDIHIEPKRDLTRVRMRIDGVLHTVYDLPKSVHSAVVSRIKTLSKLDIAEKRRPQDSRIKIDKDDVEVEIRVSTVPVAFGEKVVMRIMDPDIIFRDLETLGFLTTDLIRYNKFINMTHGIVLVCGPTGSGKSTTLYSTLRQLSTPALNITTIEDPIEMIHEDFNQIAVNPVVGITFATILRNILRQDPDIIMIGELRDLETAENAVQAAMTGHLVLSTLHTNDSASAITRLLDLGVPYFLIQATLIGIVSQRLVRKICKHCVQTFDIDAVELNAMGIDTGKNGNLKLGHGKGCIKCRGTGYLGRTSICEVLPYTKSIMEITTPDTDLQLLNKIAQKEGMINLRENAIKKMLNGETTYQEVLRVTWQQ